MVQTIYEMLNLSLIKLYLIFQVITRIILSLYALSQQQVSFMELPAIFAFGLINDLVSLCYFLPVILILNFILRKIFSRHLKLYFNLRAISYFLISVILVFTGVSELVFWDEFGTKFNFIAVDYLIYTHEIIGTISESLPLPQIIVGILLVSLIIAFSFLRSKLNNPIELNIKQLFTYSSSLLCLSFAAFKFYNSDQLILSSNKYAQELSKNGPYEFFSAYHGNSLDYNKLYTVIDARKALEIVRSKVKQDNQQFLNESDITRVFIPKKTSSTKKINVIFITVESLSSSFMGKFGNQENITPYLDKLADESLFFTKLYAVGTRTVRGLEAITLSVPPTPGSSIIRRPNNHHLFNIGSVFKDYGYDINFIYGGYSYFDNLKDYFEGNGYINIDRNNLKLEQISFANIWGVADEDILQKSLEIADHNHKSGKPFFSLIMTTSNHRPFTFPDGRIDLPSGAGRSAAVKYTDYAVGKFIEEAKKRPWFDNTIFIVTADHCAVGSGKTDLPINKYHIPLIIYAPKILQPKVVDNLASQIDISPTILGLLNFEYKSKFFGTDILNFPSNRAFISTYQLLGYMKDNYLVVLAPNNKPKTYKLLNEEKEEASSLPEFVEESISFYQTAYDFYIQNKMVDFDNN